jgi:hypothetical protein
MPAVYSLSTDLSAGCDAVLYNKADDSGVVQFYVNENNL